MIDDSNDINSVTVIINIKNMNILDDVTFVNSFSILTDNPYLMLETLVRFPIPQ